MAQRFARPSFTSALTMDSATTESGADGASTDATEDIERVTLRLDGFEMYAFLTSLIAGFSFSCLDGLETWAKMQETSPYFGPLLMIVFSLSLVVSIFSGLYATVVFALCSLYSKTALAEDKDQRMRDFLRETATFRTRGFRFFIISIVTFAGNVLLITLIRLSWLQALPTVTIGVWMLCMGLRDMSELLSCATPIFLPREPRSQPAAVQPPTTQATEAEPERPMQPLGPAGDVGATRPSMMRRGSSTSTSEWMQIAIGAKELMHAEAADQSSGDHGGDRMAAVARKVLHERAPSKSKLHTLAENFKESTLRQRRHSAADGGEGRNEEPEDQIPDS